LKEFNFFKLILFFLVILEFCLFCFGAISPLFMLKESVGWWAFNENNTSLLGVVRTFYLERELLLFLIVLVFGVLSPIAKFFAKLLKIKFAVNLFHKFSHIDIFLLVILIYVSKSSFFLEVSLGLGFYLLLASVLLGYITDFMDKSFEKD
tara:strand:+ start:631 stop:1080 length:450 start_codon:yes stop_codon:yes gene_type:complete